MNGYSTNIEHLNDELARLDVILRNEVAHVRAQRDLRGEYEGHYISDREIDALQNPNPSALPFSQEADQAAREARKRIQARCAQSSAALRLPILSQRFALNSVEREILLIALAPELDLRYQKLYAWLQDDVALKSPSVALLSRLLCSVPAERLALCHALSPGSPLLTAGLLQVRPADAAGNFLESLVSVTPPVRRFLTGSDSLEVDLLPFCRWESARVPFDELPFSTFFKQQISRLAAAKYSSAPIFLVQGADKYCSRLIAQSLCACRGFPLLLCDLSAFLELQNPLAVLPSLACELRLNAAALLFEDWHLLASDDPNLSRITSALRRMISAISSPVFLTGTNKFSPADLCSRPGLTIEVPAPAMDARKNVWRRSLPAASQPAANLDYLSALPLSLPMIETTVASASLRAQFDGTPLAERHLARAGRDLSRSNLISFATRIQPRRRWSDLILPGDSMLQLREFCAQISVRERVQQTWGFGERFSAGKAIIALFSGVTGTGKTLAAEVVAGELGLDLFKIDLSSVVSKYIGETEKNLSHVFQDAEQTRALLFFDEADALFGKRSEVKDAHDRYSNIEINFLLQRVEDYDGAIILASNLSKNIDSAFLRRLSFSIEFPLPDEHHRRSIWQSIFPVQAPVSSNVDLALLARNFRLSGGNIRNIAVAAASQAASNGGVIDMHHVILALKREYQKLGRVCDKSEFEQFYDLVRS